MPVALVKVKDIVVDQAFQVRTAIDKAWVDSLAQAFEETPELVPPIMVYKLPDGRLVVVDGFHRTRAAQLRKMKEIPAIVHHGTVVEAQDAAAEANAKATQRPLTQAERRAQVVAMAGRHPDWGQKGEIGRRLNMTGQRVGQILAAAHVARVVKSALGQIENIFNLPDTTWKAIGEADTAVWVPLARAVTQDKPASKAHKHWRTADVTQVVVALRALGLDDQEMLLGQALEGGWDAARTLSEIEVLAAVIEDAPDTEEPDDEDDMWVEDDVDPNAEHGGPVTVLVGSAPVAPADVGANGGEPLVLVAPQTKDTFTLDDWAALSDAEREQVLATRAGKSTFNDQVTKGIEWAQWSWNPVTGCKHDCSYCYARDIAERYYKHKFVPAIIPQRLAAPKHTEVPPQAAHNLAYRNVFTCSMADLFGKWVPREWIEAVLDEVRHNPQWNFLFLTKFPLRLAEFEFPANAWIGTTVDAQARVVNAEKAFAQVNAGVKWLSCEPMLEQLTFTRLDLFDWVVIGGASGSTQTPEFRPPFAWIVHLLAQAHAAGCHVYMKDNLLTRVRDFPGGQDAAPVMVQDIPGRYARPVNVPQAFKMRYLQRDVLPVHKER